MNYIIQRNSISVNGRTYRKGDKVSDVRFSESQVKDLLDNDVNNAPEKVMSGFLKQVDAEVTPEPVRAEAPGEPALPPTITDVDRITPSAEPIAPAKAAEPAPVAEVSQVADLIPKKGKA